MNIYFLLYFWLWSSDVINLETLIAFMDLPFQISNVSAFFLKCFQVVWSIFTSRTRSLILCNQSIYINASKNILHYFECYDSLIGIYLIFN